VKTNFDNPFIKLFHCMLVQGLREMNVTFNGRRSKHNRFNIAGETEIKIDDRKAVVGVVVPT